MGVHQRVLSYTAQHGRDGVTVTDYKRDLKLTHPTASAAQATLKREGKLLTTGEYRVNERGRKEEVLITPEHADTPPKKRGFF